MNRRHSGVQLVVLFLLVSVGFAGAIQRADAEAIRAVVVTGGHDYEIEPFRDLFRGYDDITPRFVDHPQAGELYAPDRASEYDVLVFYDMPRELPAHQLKNLVRLLEQGKGVVGQ